MADCQKSRNKVKISTRKLKKTVKTANLNIPRTDAPPETKLASHATDLDISLEAKPAKEKRSEQGQRESMMRSTWRSQMMKIKTLLALLTAGQELEAAPDRPEPKQSFWANYT